MSWLCGIYLSYVLFTPTKVLYDHPRVVQVAYSGQFLQALLRMLVSNVTHELFVPFRRTTILSWLLIGLNGFNMLFGKYKEPVFDEGKTFLFIAVITWAAIAHYVLFTIQELKEILNINFFTIKPKQSNPQEELQHLSEGESSHDDISPADIQKLKQLYGNKKQD